MNSLSKPCGSCGMKMENIEDFALGDTSQDLCAYCTDKQGLLLPFEKVLDMNAAFYVESKGVSHEEALKMAQDMLLTQPAWKS